MAENSSATLHAVNGEVTYLDSNERVASFLGTIGRTKELAIDTEGASFHRFVDRIYLIQVSTRDRHAIIDPLPIEAPAALGRLLEDPGVEVVFHDADYDLRLLHQDYGWHVTNIFDTRIAAQLLGISAFGLAALLERSFGVKLDKKHQRADWSMRPLPQGMLDYAAQDTLHLLGLRDALEGELKKKGRMTWAREEFARLEGTCWNAEEPGLSFFRIKGARDLTPRELALLRELVDWRDAMALRLDRATFRVVANEVLLEVARKAPASAEALGGIKGMPRGMMERAAPDVLAAVQRGLAVPETELPRFPRGLRWDKDPAFDAKVSRLKSVRDDAAKRLELDPGVLCSRDRLETIARALPRSVDDLAQIPGLRKWQIAEMGAVLVAMGHQLHDDQRRERDHGNVFGVADRFDLGNRQVMIGPQLLAGEKQVNRLARLAVRTIAKHHHIEQLPVYEAGLLQRDRDLGQIVAADQEVDVARVANRSFVDGRHPRSDGVSADDRERYADSRQSRRCPHQSFAHFRHGSLHAIKDRRVHADRLRRPTGRNVGVRSPCHVRLGPRNEFPQL